MSLHVDKKQEVDLDEECEPDNYDPEDTYMQDIASDMALEIGLRERLLETVKSRIAWALLLKESLTNETSAVLQTLPQTLSFKEAALDALAAIEAPSEILFVRDEPIPPLDTRRQSVTAKLRKKPTARAQPAMKGGKFLYIRLEGSNAPSILRCPNCLRTEFSSLQGLFNHARGTHSLAWTSHDECVRQCACALEDVQGGAVDFADLDAGVEVGAGTGGVLPGLRRLFERAVDEDDAFDLDGETALSRTLGFHVDTPALASFLGRKPIRRGVTVWDPDAVVDIDGFGADEKPRAKPRWRMPFTHRNVFTELPPQVSTPLPPVSSASPPPPATNHTRCQHRAVDFTWSPASLSSTAVCGSRQTSASERTPTSG
ncbi:hypothetical protein B0H10DRAFT_1916411 [Mycena sp. CBHHK59/15]|nr:hypothetical protein B0H10DRAFT_1916411 [Mycena sp. CBHHK59/15]